MLHVVSWWSLLIRGLAAILLGIMALTWPGIAFGAIVLLFGAYALVDGVMGIVGAVRGRTQPRWWVLLLEGLAGVAAAAVTFFWPAITALALVFVIAAWALVTGILEIVAALRLRREIRGEWLLLLGGIVSLVLGVLFFAEPAAGALAIALWLGIYALIFGVLEVALAFKLRALRERPLAHA